jgi:tetratricopeptide (TPR) repeat protein
VVNRMIRRHLNFIGEPTTAMFRKRDLAGVTPDIFSFAGEQLVTSVDVVMWINLLSRGDAIFLTEPMSDFRHHPDQEQLNEFTRREAPNVWYSLAMSTAIAGLLRPDRTMDLPVIPLGSIRPWWPEEVQAAVRGAETVLEAGEIDEAMQLLEQARAAAPDEAWISVLVGGLRLVIGDALGALREYQRALALSPEHPRILTNLASALAAIGTDADLDTAAQLAVNAARLCPDDPDAKGLMTQLLGTELRSSPASSPPG